MNNLKEAVRQYFYAQDAEDKCRELHILSSCLDCPLYALCGASERKVNYRNLIFEELKHGQP